VRNDDVIGWAKHTITGFLNALIYNLSKSKFYISKIINLLITHNSDEILETFEEEFP